jgi:hypothetical protein
MRPFDYQKRLFFLRMLVVSLLLFLKLETQIDAKHPIRRRHEILFLVFRIEEVGHVNLDMGLLVPKPLFDGQIHGGKGIDLLIQAGFPLVDIPDN